MIGRSIVLLILVAILAFGGIIWFDFLNIIDAKDVLAPIYRFIPFVPGDGRTHPVAAPDEDLNIDHERLVIRLQAIELLRMEMEAQQMDIDTQRGIIEQMAQEVEERQRAVEEMQKSITDALADAENRDRNIEQNARYLTGMPPEDAVGIINALDDQDAIDVLRKTEEIAQAEGTMSIVSYWLSLMEPERAAELQRKMAGRPAGF